MSEHEAKQAEPRSALDEVLAQLAIYRSGSVVEIGAINSNVRSYCEHWEGRAEQAESDLAALKAKLEEADAANVYQWSKYDPEHDHSREEQWVMQSRTRHASRTQERKG